MRPLACCRKDFRRLLAWKPIRRSIRRSIKDLSRFEHWRTGEIACLRRPPLTNGGPQQLTQRSTPGARRDSLGLVTPLPPDTGDRFASPWGQDPLHRIINGLAPPVKRYVLKYSRALASGSA